MIVRESTTGWLLISQVEHARIAAEIAVRWRLPAALRGLDEQFHFAVEHHDDGWREWEQAPTIDDDDAPRDFMDMPMPVATDIWCDSINRALQHSLWSGLWVSRHFCYLADLAIEHREADADRSAARRFLAMQAFGQKHWRQSLGVQADSPIELLGLQALQFFDRLSLWLCMAERTAEQTFPDPSGGTTRWTPESATTIEVSGDGFTSDELSMTAPAVSIERRRYADDVELRAAIANGARTSVNWTLRSS